MSKIGFPGAMVCWLLALVAFGQWLNGGIEYIGDERIVASAPGTGAIVLTILGGVFWLWGRRATSTKGGDRG